MITVLFGENAYAATEKLKQIKKDFIKLHGETGLETYQAESIQPNQLASIVGGADTVCDATSDCYLWSFQNRNC